MTKAIQQIMLGTVTKNEKQAAYAKLIRSGYSVDIAAEATKRWYEAKNSK